MGRALWAQAISQGWGLMLTPTMLCNAGGRDLSKPAYRSAALHAMLSPSKPIRANRARGKTNGADARRQHTMRVSVSAPTSPYKHTALAGAGQEASQLCLEAAAAAAAALVLDCELD